MPRICEAKKCRAETEGPADRFCGTHAIAELRRIRRAHPGYFQPLRIRTVEGVVRLSDRPYLLLEDEEQTGTGTSPSPESYVDC